MKDYERFYDDIINLLGKSSFNVFEASIHDRFFIDVRLHKQKFNLHMNECGLFTSILYNANDDLTYIDANNINSQLKKSDATSVIFNFFSTLFSQKHYNDFFKMESIKFQNFYLNHKLKKIYKNDIVRIMAHILRLDKNKIILRSDICSFFFKYLEEDFHFSQVNFFKFTKDERLLPVIFFSLPSSLICMEHNFFIVYNIIDKQFYFVNKHEFFFEDFFNANKVFDFEKHSILLLQHLLYVVNYSHESKEIRSIVDNLDLDFENNIELLKMLTI